MVPHKENKQNPNSRHTIITEVGIPILLIQLKENNHKDTKKGITIKI
jgi:hypothetical protein